MPDVRTIFADGILDASVTHGVARLTLAQTGPEAAARLANFVAKRGAKVSDPSEG